MKLSVDVYYGILLKQMAELVLVTGAAGYLGSRLVPKLLELGHKVICVDNLMYEPTSLVVPASHPNCEFIFVASIA